MKRNFTFLLLFSVFVARAQAQVSTTHFINDPAVVSAVSLFINTQAEQSGIYRGIGYTQPRLSTGHVFFQAEDWQKSNILYEENTYENIDARYDLVNDQLIIRYFDGITNIQLYQDLVKSFSIAGHTFIYIDQGLNGVSPKGFYDVLYKGGISLFAKRKKTIRERISGGVIREASESAQYYLLKDNKYYSIGSKKDLIKITGNDLQQYIKENKLLFKDNIEVDLLKAVKFYDQTPH